MKRIKYIFGEILVIQDITENSYYNSEYDRLDDTGSFTADQIRQDLDSRNIKQYFEEEKLLRFEDTIKRNEVYNILKGMPLSEIKALNEKGILDIRIKYLVEQAIKEKLDAIKTDDEPQAFAFLFEKAKEKVK